MTEKTEPYAPIGCARYSEYEVAILHRQKLRLRWREDNVFHEQVVLPIDLKTLNHEEFLIARDGQGQQLCIRLDRIQRMEPA